MDRKSVRRVLLVILGMALTAALTTYFTDLPRGLGGGFLSLPVWTLMTIPDDLQPGEYDLFGLGVLVLVLIVGLIALAMNAGGATLLQRRRSSGV